MPLPGDPSTERLPIDSHYAPLDPNVDWVPVADISGQQGPRWSVVIAWPTDASRVLAEHLLELSPYYCGGRGLLSCWCILCPAASYSVQIQRPLIALFQADCPSLMLF